MDLAFRTLSELLDTPAFDEVINLYLRSWHDLIKWEGEAMLSHEDAANFINNVNDHAPNTQIVAMHNGHVVGSIHGKVMDENHLHVASIAQDSYKHVTDDFTFEHNDREGSALVCTALQVDQEFSGKGIGSRLINAIKMGFAGKLEGDTSRVPDAAFSDALFESFGSVDVNKIFAYTRLNQYRNFMRRTGEYIEPEDYAGFFEQMRDNSVFRVTADMDGVTEIFRKDASYFHIVKNGAEWVRLCKNV